MRDVKYGEVGVVAGWGQGYGRQGWGSLVVAGIQKCTMARGLHNAW